MGSIRHECGLCSRPLLIARGYTHYLSERCVQNQPVNVFPANFQEQAIGWHVHSRCLVASGCADKWRQCEWNYDQRRTRRILSDAGVIVTHHLSPGCSRYDIYRETGKISVELLDLEEGLLTDSGFAVHRSSFLDIDLSERPLLAEKLRADFREHGASDLRPILDWFYENDQGSLYRGLQGTISPFDDDPEETFEFLKQGVLSAGYDYDLLLTPAEFEVIGADWRKGNAKLV